MAYSTLALGANVVVEENRIALCGPVKLPYLGDPKALCERDKDKENRRNNRRWVVVGKLA